MDLGEDSAHTHTYIFRILNTYLHTYADPKHAVLAPQTLLELATVYKNLKQYSDAKEAAKKVLEIDDNNVLGQAYILIFHFLLYYLCTNVALILLGHKILGQIHMDADEFDEAVFQFKKATELSQVW